MIFASSECVIVILDFRSIETLSVEISQNLDIEKLRYWNIKILKYSDRGTLFRTVPRMVCLCWYFTPSHRDGVFMLVFHTVGVFWSVLRTVGVFWLVFPTVLFGIGIWYCQVGLRWLCCGVCFSVCSTHVILFDYVLLNSKWNLVGFTELVENVLT